MTKGQRKIAKLNNALRALRPHVVFDTEHKLYKPDETNSARGLLPRLNRWIDRNQKSHLTNQPT
jgi:hypothetical protein